MSIKSMSQDDLRLVLDWAADEGWNPGIDDAQVFYNTDPSGFLIKWEQGHPAAAISVVNHSDSFAFLGLYIAHPRFRGQGHGLDVWRAGLAHAGNRTVGLDGVPAQQGNYVRSGFAYAGSTNRYSGMIDFAGNKAAIMTQDDLPSVLNADRSLMGLDRKAFLEPWLNGCSSRKTFILSEGANTISYVTARECRRGVKVGPMVAYTASQVEYLLGSVADAFPGETFYIDVPGRSTDLVELLEDRGFVPVFETARMYLGQAPRGNPQPFEAVATLELG
ncbi:MAG: GNAT family N-acetyltransferase [Paracoccaceae bacterium]